MAYRPGAKNAQVVRDDRLLSFRSPGGTRNVGLPSTRPEDSSLLFGMTEPPKVSLVLQRRSSARGETACLASRNRRDFLFR
jgi:hypothetical protein